MTPNRETGWRKAVNRLEYSSDFVMAKNIGAMLIGPLWNHTVGIQIDLATIPRHKHGKLPY